MKRPVIFNAKFALPIGAALAFASLATPGLANSYLTQQQLLSMLPGHIVMGTSSGGAKFARSFGPGQEMGKVTNKGTGTFSTEGWYVQGNSWCEEDGFDHTCYQVQQVNANTLQAYQGGKPLETVWTLQ